MESKKNRLLKLGLPIAISFLVGMPDGFEAVNDNVPILELSLIHI